MSDDGVGPRVVERLRERHRFPPEVRVLDGGTLGLDLLPYLEGVENLVIVDALDIGAAPGTVRRLSGDEVPAAFSTKLSPHQMGLQDLLAVANLQGYAPPNIVLWGVQPASIDVGMDLSAVVEPLVDVLVEKVAAELEKWSFRPRRL